jgi:hypothetical protein
VLLRLLAGTSLLSGLRQRLKDSLRRLGVTLALLLLAAFFFGLAILYLVHAFYAWLAAPLGMSMAALATAGLVAVLGLLVLGIVALTRARRHRPAQPSALGPTAVQLGQTAGLAAAARLFRGGGWRAFRRLTRRISPRYIVLGVGVALTLLAFSLVRGRERRED